MHINPPIGVLGGTFDPIHVGHLRMGIELFETLQLARIHVVPCYQPVHRGQPVASVEDRVAMVKLAISDEPSLYYDSREIDRKGASYMIDTLLHLNNELPTTPLCLLIGIDAFLGFSHWHRATEILYYAHLIVAHRPRYHLPATGIIAHLLKKHLRHDIQYIHEHMAGGILLQPIASLDVSASDIRKTIGMGRNPRYLLPDKVYDYLQQHGIYRNKVDTK